MFTGIIESTGKVLKIVDHSGSRRLTIGHSFSTAIKVGESINLNGACQTVIDKSGNSFTVEAMRESLTRTNLGFLKRGDSVDLERSLRPSDRLSGHLVTGHVDCTGEIVSIEELPASHLVEIRFPTLFGKYVAPKGSIAVDGISLTIIDKQSDSFTAGIVPFTWQNTNLKDSKAGKKVNLEFDLVAKYIESLNSEMKAPSKITSDFLEKAGFGRFGMKG